MHSGPSQLGWGTMGFDQTWRESAWQRRAQHDSFGCVWRRVRASAHWGRVCGNACGMCGTPRQAALASGGLVWLCWAGCMDLVDGAARARLVSARRRPRACRRAFAIIGNSELLEMVRLESVVLLRSCCAECSSLCNVLDVHLKSAIGCTSEL